MPKFLDYHEKAPQMPPEMVQQMVTAIKAGQSDPFGVRALNAFQGGGHAWCLTEAPSADAVCQSHEAVGITLDKGDVTEVQSYV